MTFTYSGAPSTDKDRVRFTIRDTTENEGPRPEGANFSDEELAALITTEGIWQRAVASALESLAVEWTSLPTYSADNFSVSNSHIALGYSRQAKEWRDKWGSIYTKEVYPRAGAGRLIVLGGHNEDDYV